MDLNTLLIWTVAASCGITSLQLLRSPRRHWPRLLLPAAVGGVLAVCLVVDRGSAGYIAGLFWLLLMLLPALGRDRVNRLLGARRLSAARQLAGWLAWLQPVRENRHLPTLIRALELLQQGNQETGLALLRQLATEETGVERTARVVLTRQTGDWTGFLSWIESAFPNGALPPDPLLIDAYLQALGETGRRHDMLAEYQRAIGSRGLEFSPGVANMIRAKLAAFSGDVLLTTQILASSAAETSPELMRFWTATALQAAGRTDEAQSELESLAALSSPVAISARRRLDKPVADIALDPLSDSGRQILVEAAQLAGQEQEVAVLRPLSPGTLRGTWSIVAVLVAVFLVEIPGGPQNLDNLERLGARVIPVALKPGESWRVVTAAFLHMGTLHLTLNLLGVIVFGRWLERLYGSGRMLVIYLASAIGAVALAPLFMFDATLQTPTILVGASGGVMGLIGGLTARSGLAAWKTRSRRSVRDFRTLVMIIVLQSAFDFSTPHVSSACHLLGLSIGFCLGILLRPRSLFRPAHPQP